MTVPLSRLERRSPRQAIAFFERPASGRWPEQLRRAVLLDLVGAAVSVNGASIFVAVPVGWSAKAEEENALPAGVNPIEVAAKSVVDGASTIFERLFARGFTRVVLVAADSIGVAPRTLTTALSAAGSTGSVAGRDERGGLYLAGLASGRHLGSNRWLLDGLGSDAVAGRPPEPIVWVESARALAGLHDPISLREALEARATLSPRAFAWIAGDFPQVNDIEE